MKNRADVKFAAMVDAATSARCSNRFHFWKTFEKRGFEAASIYLIDPFWTEKVRNYYYDSKRD